LEVTVSSEIGRQEPNADKMLSNVKSAKGGQVSQRQESEI